MPGERVHCWSIWAQDASINPLRIWSPMSLTWPGPWGMKTVVFLDELPRSLMVSKYCVIMMRSITSLADVPVTLCENSSMFSLKPSVIACLCLATPTPPRYLASASASALLTRSTFSASPLYTLASWSRWAEIQNWYAKVICKWSWGSQLNAINSKQATDHYIRYIEPEACPKSNTTDNLDSKEITKKESLQLLMFSKTITWYNDKFHA